jgi:hypothetical protein
MQIKYDAEKFCIVLTIIYIDVLYFGTITDQELTQIKQGLDDILRY